MFWTLILMVHRKQKIMFWIKFSLLQTSPHHGFVLNLLHDLIFWRRRRRRTWRTSSRPKRLRWRRRMILMMVEATKSYIWFGGPYKALNHPKSSSRNPCGPNCLLLLLLLLLLFLFLFFLLLRMLSLKIHVHWLYITWHEFQFIVLVIYLSLIHNTSLGGLRREVHRRWERDSDIWRQIFSRVHATL